MKDRIVEFLKDRIPLEGALRRFLYEDLPENAGWFHTLGSLLLFLILLQFLTGAFLMFFYAPTPDHARNSLDYLTSNFTSGSLLRSLHVWGASLIVIAITLHMLRVVLQGAYKNPREMNWVSGMFLFLMVLGFSFTGYLLPWDQRGYWATQVGTEMVGQGPVLGPPLKELLRGGSDLGPYTLTRFFTLHVIFLPALLLTFLLLHLYLLRKHKIAPHPLPEKRSSKTFPFFPYQVFRDLSVFFVVFGILLLLAHFFPAHLEPKANPTDTHYDPRPEWYFLAHYELLRLFTGMEVVPVVIIPTILILALFGLPFVDRYRSRFWKDRKPLVYTVTAFFLLLYGAVAYSKIVHPAAKSGSNVVAAESLPLPPEGDKLTLFKGRRVFQNEKCSRCHAINGVGGHVGPDLMNVGGKRSSDWIREQVLHPKSHNPKSKMPTFDGKISNDDLNAVVEYLSHFKQSR